LLQLPVDLLVDSTDSVPSLYQLMFHSTKLPQATRSMMSMISKILRGVFDHDVSEGDHVSSCWSQSTSFEGSQRERTLQYTHFASRRQMFEHNHMCRPLWRLSCRPSSRPLSSLPVGFDRVAGGLNSQSCHQNRVPNILKRALLLVGCWFDASWMLKLHVDKPTTSGCHTNS